MKSIKKHITKFKLKNLSTTEMMSAKFAGFIDGRKGLITQTDDGKWWSSRLKREVDNFEEYSARLFTELSVCQGESFSKLNFLFDHLLVLKDTFSNEKLRLGKVVDDTANIERRFGEENLPEDLIVKRRSLEKKKEIDEKEKNLNEIIETIEKNILLIFDESNKIEEEYNLTCQRVNHLAQHIYLRIDAYWQSAVKQNPKLSSIPNIIFSNQAQKEFDNIYNKYFTKVDALREELAKEEF